MQYINIKYFLYNKEDSKYIHFVTGSLIKLSVTVSVLESFCSLLDGNTFSSDTFSSDTFSIGEGSLSGIRFLSSDSSSSPEKIKKKKHFTIFMEY